MQGLTFQRMRWIALVVFLVQFTNALEYMMVTPLFPLMAERFGQDVSQAGYVASSYTLASVISGLVGFFFLDRLHKKSVIISSLLMIGLLTSLVPLMSSFPFLLMIRFITGLLGGILLAAVMALLLDLIPKEVRGKMIALVLSAFPLVSITGLPLTLWLAKTWQWQGAFYLLAGICLLSMIAIIVVIPSAKIPAGDSLMPVPKLRLNRQILLGAISPGISNVGTFMLVPLLVPIYQVLLQMPASEIPWLFFIGGIGALVGTKLAGRWNHPHQISYLLLGSTGVLLLSILDLGLMIPARWFAYSFSFLLMFATYLRFTGITILCANIPKATERGGFTALQTAFNHLSASIAFMVAAIGLQQREFSIETFSFVLYLILVSILLLMPCLWELKRCYSEITE